MSMSEEYLPTDLILEIISKLPSKSIARCRCLSKLWVSLITPDSPYFTELFLTQSKTQPRLLFAFRDKYNNWSLYSCRQPQISYKNDKSSILVTAKFHMSLYHPLVLHMPPPISGLLCFPRAYGTSTLCNPSTRSIFGLPYPPRPICSFFGYDPINKQFNLLAFSSATVPFTSRDLPTTHQILKLGSERVSWRNVECPLHHYPSQDNICINGILYYFACFELEGPCKLASFDFNTEAFKFIDVPWPHRPHILVNFKGKLGGIDTNRVGFGEERFNLELSLWVLEDVEKQEWSKHVYYLPSRMWNTKLPDIFVIGVTATGDVVLSLRYTTLDPLCVYFFNLEENILRKVEIKGFERSKFHSFINASVDYVEDLTELNWI